MLSFTYCGYANLICRVLAPLHSAAFTLVQVKRLAVYGVVIVSYIAPYWEEIDILVLPINLILILSLSRQDFKLMLILHWHLLF